MASLNPYFQVGLDVHDQPCLVIGGGGEAEDKVGRLMVAGADITVVSPTLTPRLEEWAATGSLTAHRRLFEEADVAGNFLVLSTVGGDHGLSQQVYQVALRERSLVNCYDSPSCSNFGMVALVAAGPLRLGISTSNASPSLAGRLRSDLHALFDDEFVEFVELLARVRGRLGETMADSSARRKLLRSLVADFRLCGDLVYPPDWRRRMGDLLGGV